MKKQTRMLALTLAALMTLALGAGCAQQPVAVEPTAAPEATQAAETPVPATEISGTFEGEGHGMQGPIKVNVTVDKGAITAIEYVAYNETANITAVAKERIPAQIVEHQSLSVDTVTGATLSSYGIMNAVADAAKNAGLDVDALKANKYTATPKADETWDTDVLVMGGGGGLIRGDHRGTARRESHPDRKRLHTRRQHAGGGRRLQRGGPRSPGAHEADEGAEGHYGQLPCHG